MNINKTVETKDIASMVVQMAAHSREAALELATLSTEKKNEALATLAQLIEENVDELIEVNKKDLEGGDKAGLGQALLDRLKFTPERITQMADGVKEVIALSDPVGEEMEKTLRPNGLEIRKVRVPIGVVGIIYESRPNVTVDCAILCFKSGNASILRGGKEAFHTNTALAELIRRALIENAINENTVQFIPTTDRSALNTLLKCDDSINCIIPRGGESLIRFVVDNATVPVIKHYEGVCNVYVDRAADPDMANKIVINAKCQRPGVCNAAENLFIHKDIAAKILPDLGKELVNQGVELRADGDAEKILSEANGIPVTHAKEEDFYKEYLDLILSVRVVDSLEDAIRAVNKYGSSHSDAIVTEDESAAHAYMTGVDTATVYWNASTRFTDGYEFGMGAEIGISTDKLHARGPMGLHELTSYKYLIFGSGQVK
jgi:glutamate-5-semialdehyde dehydrogenase